MPTTNYGLTEQVAALADFYQGAAIAVGNGTTAYDPAQTDLTGASKARVACASVTASGDSITFIADFPPGVAEFSWEEAGAASSLANPLFIRDLVESLGVKPVDRTWVVQLVVAFANE